MLRYSGEITQENDTIYLPVIINGENSAPPTAVPTTTRTPTATRLPGNTPTPTATPRPAGPTQVCGAINGAQTWTTAASPYVITCDVTIGTGSGLTVMAGVIVKFRDDASLLVDGTLQVQGAAGNLVYFTSYKDDLLGGDTNGDGSTTPNAGDWGRVQFNSTSNDDSLLEHLEIRYSGEDSFRNYGATRFDNASPTLRNITFLNNFINGIDIPASQWQTDTWDNTDVVYYVRGDVTVESGQTLTMVAGIKVKFLDDASLFVNDTLRVLGTAEQPIYFTSYRDDLIGGDTNNNGSNTTPATGDWGRVQFNSTSNDANSRIEHLEIRFSGEDSFINYGAIRFDNASPVLHNIIFSGNYINGVEIPASQWETDTWDNTDVVYYVRGDVAIQSGQTLTVMAGMKVKFFDDASLLVDDTLRVLGTAESPVYFTSYRDDLIGGDTNNDGSTTPATGNWGRVQFNRTSNDANALIEYLEIRYSGEDSFVNYGAIRFDNASPTVRNIVFSKNYINGVEIPPSQWETDTWDNTDIVYYVRGDVTIQSGQTLTIAAGIKVKFLDDASLFVDDTLRVLGSADQPVYFTSYRDDLIGGDTNNDATATTPGHGNWGRVQFNSNSNAANSLIEHLEIRYGGEDSFMNYGAIRLDGKSITISSTTFKDNYRGVEALANAAPIIRNSNFSGHQSHAVYNATPAVTVDARNNWWGSPSGPHHPTQNPSGQGDAVSDGVDFSGWTSAEN